MTIFLEIIAIWAVGALTIGPILSWAFFYPVRRERAARQASAFQDHFSRQ